MFGNHKRLEAKLREGGHSAPAEVLSCQTEGTITHGNPQLVANTEVICKLRLQVRPDGEPPFEAKTTARYSQFSIPGQGDTVTVLYDPSDHGKVVVDVTPAAAVHQVLAKQIARFQAMDDPVGKIIADKLEAANNDGTLPQLGNDRASIQAYNAAFRQVVDDAKREAGLGPGPAVFIGGHHVDPAALTGGHIDPAEELTKLADLRDRGVLTEAEFQTQKAKILAAP